MIDIYPSVTGIAVTDENGTICDENGTIITQYADEMTRKLDSRVLTKTIQSLSDNNTLFVCGQTTWKDMGGPLQGTIKTSNVVTSDNKGAYYHVIEKVKYDDCDWMCSKAQLFSFVFEIAMRRNYKNICVLGGKSVYEAFAKHYCSFTHCKIKDVQCNGKQIDVIPDDLFGQPENTLFNTPNVNYSIPIDNKVYKVTVYGG